MRERDARLAEAQGWEVSQGWKGEPVCKRPVMRRGKQVMMWTPLPRYTTDDAAAMGLAKWLATHRRVQIVVSIHPGEEGQLKYGCVVGPIPILLRVHNSLALAIADAAEAALGLPKSAPP